MTASDGRRGCLQLLVAIVVSTTPFACRADCVRDTIGVPVSLATRACYNTFGNAQGETFFADDTLISSITVWRWPGNITLGLQLFIAGTRPVTTGTGYVPLTSPLLYSAPVVSGGYSDSLGHPVPIRWVFDPPVALPRRGEYVFWIQNDRCDAFDYPIECYEGGDAYPHGTGWYTNRDLFGPCVHVPPLKGGGLETTDMCFEMVFCRGDSAALEPGLKATGSDRVHARRTR